MFSVVDSLLVLISVLLSESNGGLVGSSMFFFGSRAEAVEASIDITAGPL